MTQLAASAEVMSSEFVLRSDASGGGLQQPLIERFLRETQRGNAEQFSTSFALLARSLGVDARVATGFEVDAGTTSGGSFVLRSDDARIWPEVRVGDSWVAFDPVPEQEASDAIPPEPEPQVQTPAAPQPPIAPPPESADEPVVTDDEAADDAATGLSPIATFALVTAGGVGGLLVPVLIVVAVILLLKHRRRRRLLGGAATDRIVGAWAVATGRFADAGVAMGVGDTDDDLATAGVAEVPAAGREVRRLAALASAATFGSPARPDLLAEDAAGCLGRVETEMAATRSRRDRLRWRLSLRSLRRSTRSPVVPPNA